MDISCSGWDSPSSAWKRHFRCGQLSRGIRLAIRTEEFGEESNNVKLHPAIVKVLWCSRHLHSSQPAPSALLVQDWSSLTCSVNANLSQIASNSMLARDTQAHQYSPSISRCATSRARVLPQIIVVVIIRPHSSRLKLNHAAQKLAQGFPDALTQPRRPSSSVSPTPSLLHALIFTTGLLTPLEPNGTALTGSSSACTTHDDRIACSEWARRA